jgi:hypothetical protein
MAATIKRKYGAEMEELADPLVPQAAPREYTIVYTVVLIFAYWHMGALYGLFLAFTSAKRATLVFSMYPLQN